MRGLILTLIALSGTYHSGAPPVPPGLVVGLAPTSGAMAPAAPDGVPAAGAGLRWHVLTDRPAEDPADWRLPPGIVLALTRADGTSDQRISAFGQDAVSGATGMPGFRRRHGGGLVWYESTGAGFDDLAAAPHSGWLSALPSGAVLGLKHARDHESRRWSWGGATYDPADPAAAPPRGFRRVAGPDLADPPGSDFFWFARTADAAGGRP